jgi:hypothetical protein
MGFQGLELVGSNLETGLMDPSKPLNDLRVDNEFPAIQS